MSTLASDDSVVGEGETRNPDPSGGWLVLCHRGLDVGYALWVVGHLSTIVLGVQDRASFEAALGAEGEWQRAGAVLVAVWLLVRGLVSLAFAAPPWSRLLTLTTLLTWWLYALGVGTGQPLLGPVDYDSWCAAMSATWFAIPWRAMGYLLALALTAVEVKQSLTRVVLQVVPTGRLGQRREPLATWVSWLVAAAIALLGAKSVFALATGSAAIF